MAQVSYDTIRLPLDTAQEYAARLAMENDYFNFIDAINALDGSQNLEAKVEIAFGKDATKYVPIRLNTQVRGRFDMLKFKWLAQPGVVGIFYVAATINQQGGARPLEVIAPPPKQLVTMSAGTSLANGAVNVTNVATAIVAANVLRQGLTLQNQGAVDVFIGGATVTAVGATRGLRLSPGASMPVDNTTAAIYGITAAGAADIVFLSEES